MLGAAYALFGRRCGLRPFFLASLLFLCGGPFRIAVANGQLSIVALAFVVLALWACRGRFYLLSGLCLAFSLLKYHLVLPFLVLFLPDRRRWIALGTCALIHLLWHLALCWQIGASPVGIVWRIVQLNTGVGARHDWFDVRSLARWAAGRFRPDVDPLWFLLPFLVLLAAWLAFLCWRSRKNPDDLAWMSVLAAFGLVATYHRVYDAVVLAFPALWTATGKGAWLRKGLAWLCLAVLTLAFPVLRYEWWKNRLPREALWLWTAPALWVLTVTLLSLFRREPPPESGSELAHRREDHVAAGLVNA
jgi:hypothetical protein